jgi:hypothetical protein
LVRVVQVEQILLVLVVEDQIQFLVQLLQQAVVVHLVTQDRHPNLALPKTKQMEDQVVVQKAFVIHLMLD